MIQTYNIEGKIKPYVRMTQRGKWVKKNAREYLASKSSIGLQARNQMVLYEFKMFPRQTSLSVDIIFYVTGMHHCDLDNQVKAVLDGLQGIVYKDDRWIDFITAKRVKYKRDCTQIIVEEKQ